MLMPLPVAPPEGQVLEDDVGGVGQVHDFAAEAEAIEDDRTFAGGGGDQDRRSGRALACWKLM